MEQRRELETAIEIIGNALFEMGLNINFKDNLEVNSLLSNIKDCFVLIHWPESQSYMDEEWFEEESVLNEDSSYFIPLSRVVERDCLEKV